MRKLFIYLIPLLIFPALAGCGSMIFDDEVGEDCNPHYYVNFRFDMNMKWADAFPVEVNHVTLYVIDEETGKILWRASESGQQLKAEGYRIELPVAPGHYKLLAWCGDGLKSHFSVPEAELHSDLTCALLTEQAGDGGSKIQKPLDRLYHGKLDNQLFPEAYGTYTYTVELVKNTNEINVVLQHISGKPVESDKFRFSITDDNSLMDWDNSLVPNGQTTYHAHRVMSGSAGVDRPDASRTLTQVNACVASLSTARLVKGNDMRLHVHDNQGNEIVNIPVIDYALLVKGYEAGSIPDQEYLDRQDKYDMVFFLNEHDQWLKTDIYINSWRIVFKETEL